MNNHALVWFTVAACIASSASCLIAETGQQSPVPDSSHAVPADCSEGETRCLVNLLQRCIGRQFRTILACEDTCDPIDECIGTSSNFSSYIWIANTGEGTLSKVNTRTAKEEGRFYTCPFENARCDPSRTSVNLHGDAVVTNRGAKRDIGPIPSSVTKYAANIMECVDRNGNGIIETSTGPNDIKQWGEDECMMWNQELPNANFYEYGSHGARATSWDGSEDVEGGQGGLIWIGTCSTTDVRVFRLNGDTGAIEDEIVVPGVSCAYGGAVDSDGNFWFFGYHTETITRVDAISLEVDTRDTSCGYGITIDEKGRIWTGGLSFTSPTYGSCIARYDPQTGAEDIVGVHSNSVQDAFDGMRLRGIAVGTGKTSGYVWAAETIGTLYQIDEETMQIVDSYTFTPDGRVDISMIGVAVDYMGFVWTVARATNQAYKYDPLTREYLTVNIGYRPYTYSDMTGVQLMNVIVP